MIDEMTKEDLLKTLEEAFQDFGMVSKDQMEKYVDSHMAKVRKAQAEAAVPQDLRKFTELVAKKSDMSYEEVAAVTAKNAESIRRLSEQVKRDKDLMSKAHSSPALTQFYGPTSTPEPSHGPVEKGETVSGTLLGALYKELEAPREFAKPISKSTDDLPPALEGFYADGEGR